MYPSRRNKLVMTALAAPLAAGIALLAVPAAGASPTDLVKPIGPDQAFTGQTHGQLGTDKILMVCPGGTSSGHPAGGQSVEVIPAVATVSGFTGTRGHRIAVTFPSPVTSGPIVLEAYGVEGTIPTSLVLPCSGTGIVRFTPEPHSNNARPDLVTVSFDPGPAAR